MAPYFRLLLELGRFEEAAEVLAEIGPYQVQMERMGYVPFIWIDTGLAEAELALAQSRPAEALQVMERLAADMEQRHTRFWYAEVLYTQAQALLELERTRDAQNVLERARLEAEALRARRMLWLIYLASGRIAARQNDPVGAERHFRKGRQVVQEIVERIERPALRASFMQRSDVQALFAQPVAEV
jgi:hypothetical protein